MPLERDNGQWPITYGVSRDQMMARHVSNDIQCVYAGSVTAADRALLTKAAMTVELGIEVTICGTKKTGLAGHE